MSYNVNTLAKLDALKALGQKQKKVDDAQNKRIKALEDVGAQANVIESVKVNGTVQAIATDKTLTRSDTPADAAAVGEALAGKAEALHTHNYAGSDSAGGTAASVNGFTFAAQTTDPGADSALETGKVLIVYE